MIQQNIQMIAQEEISSLSATKLIHFSYSAREKKTATQKN